MTKPEKLRRHLQANLGPTIGRINAALRAKGLARLKPVLARIGRGQQLPHWYQQLSQEGTLPNLDGKTVGSVVEMLLVAILETFTFLDMDTSPLRINPARGVDLPDLELGVKSPSENFCTSEPFFSAYERLLGSGHDVLVLLTDYQDKKKQPPLRLQIIKWHYLRSTQVADESLCRIAKAHRKWLVKDDEARAQRFFRFLAYINQSDWRAKRILKMFEHLRDEKAINEDIKLSREDFNKKNRELLRKNKVPIPETEITAIESISRVRPVYFGVLDAADNWLVDARKETARAPSDFEWKALISSPLEGAIGMSLALQWRYNFGRLFGAKQGAKECEEPAG